MAVTKRYNVPKFWNLEIKAKKYAVSPSAGPHSFYECVPIGIVLRNLIGNAHTMKEAKQILSGGMVKINGHVRRKHNFPVGLMDVVDIDGDFYRMLPSKYGIKPFVIEKNEADMKLSKIKNKTMVKKSRLQLNLHDGTNMLVPKDEYKTSDVVVIDVSRNVIKETLKFEKGATAVVTAGRNIGAVGTINHIDKKLRTIILEVGGRKLPVPIRYVFVVGRGQPVIKIGE